ncbi:cold shock domain-containing protein [Streptomyces sp. NPDC051172]|uniref:cold shock domain-containing protein n=1 Tax=Streptomyces sp. NPDC051172 TaxID=3155796 RepID=UPI00341A8A00
MAGCRFLEPADGGPDVFVHFSAVQSTGFKELYEGDRVEYAVTQGPKGPQAENVVRQQQRSRSMRRAPHRP